jgi:hypothetical protein
MGRYYNGTISGKFWFGVQSSRDLSNFKEQPFEEPTELYYYYECGCTVECMDYKYCSNCYKSYKDHYNAYFDNLLYKEDKIKKGKIIAYLTNVIEYNFDDTEIPFIQNKLDELEEEIGIDLINNLEYKINEDDFDYNINWDFIDENNIIFNQNIATWCIGKQVKNALIKNNYCKVLCETQ